MNEDLKTIRKKYGEKMMHLCRELFPDLLEYPGLLSRIILSNYAPSRFLYEDIIQTSNVSNFRNYIYYLSGVKEEEVFPTSKTPKELLSEVGYDLYECKTEGDIQSFKKYYKKGEELCTFKGGRLERCYVFFAIKKDISQIKRENFNTPRREDDYGISVISIQFSKGAINTLSIKNRYNHTVNNPDATFSNNLENIIPGLTDAFESEYDLIINQNNSKNFILPGYVKASDGKFYKYNYERNNIYYCPNNIIIDNFEVKKFEAEQYIILDDFVLDLKNKKIELYDKYRKDSFVDGLKEIEKISVNKFKDENTKEIKIITKKGNEIIIELDKLNRIIGYKNNEITGIKDNFLLLNKSLKYLELKEVRSVGNSFLSHNLYLKNFDIPNLQSVGDHGLCFNRTIEVLNFPNLLKVGHSFLSSNELLKYIYVPKLIEVGNSFLFRNRELKKGSFPSLIKAGDDFLGLNLNMEELECPRLYMVGDRFFSCNDNVKRVSFPKLKKVGLRFMEYDKKIISLYVPKLNRKSKEILKDLFRYVEQNNKQDKIIQNSNDLYKSPIKSVKKANNSLTQYIKEKINFILNIKQEKEGKSK